MAPRAHDTNSSNGSTEESTATQDSCTTDASPWIQFTGIIRYAVAANGITVQRKRGGDPEDEDSGNWVKWTTLPKPHARYESTDGLVYIIPKSWGGIGHVKAVDADSPKSGAFLSLGYHEAHAALSGEGGKELRSIWFTVANDRAVISESPRVTQGVPPLAPQLVPTQPDRERASNALRYVGKRLTSTGRAIMSLALVAPWLIEVGATSLLVHIYGQAGQGKTALAQAVAALYGDPDLDTGEGIGISFNTTSTGLIALAQSHSYLPLVIDEIQSAGGVVPEDQLVGVIMGASRKRATRAGGAAASRGRWASLMVTTGNDSLNLERELWNRRALQAESSNLWTGSFETPEWGEIHRAMNVYAAYPWAEVEHNYMPGTDLAQTVAPIVDRATRPGPGSLGTAGALAQVGADILADFTGLDWGEGLTEAWAELMQAKLEETRDPARDVSNAILTSMAENSGAWSETADREAAGYMDKGNRNVCGVEHDESCTWYNVLPTMMDTAMAGMTMKRLGRTAFRHALLMVDSYFTRKVMHNKARTRVYTVCIEALSVLGEPPAPIAPTQQPPAPLPVAPTPAPAPAEPEAQPKLAEVTASRETIVHAGNADVLASLNAAAEAGATDVTGPNRWAAEVETIQTQWNTNWTGAGASAMADRKSDGHRLRIWAAPTSHVSPDEYAQALRRYRVDHPKYSGPTQEIHRALTTDRKHKHQLDKELRDLWTPAEIMHPTGWGESAVSVDKSTVTQYDRNKAYLSALTQANLAPLSIGEGYETYGADAPVTRGLAGMYRIVVPEWDSVLPGPSGRVEPGSEVWTTAEIMRLYDEADMRPDIIEARLAPVHRVPAVHALHSQITQELNSYSGHPARMIPKSIYQRVHAALSSEWSKAKRGRVYRPDWAQAMRDNAWASVVRTAWKVHAEDSRFVPVTMNTDAIYYPADLPRPPVIRLGDGLGEFKIEGK